MSNNQSHITIRPATDADAGALARLAQLDSSRVPSQPLLAAHVDGDLRAAISMADGTAIADPFRRTADLVAMLRLEAGVQAPEPATSLRSYRRLWRRSPRPSAPSVPGIPVLPTPR